MLSAYLVSMVMINQVTDFEPISVMHLSSLLHHNASTMLYVIAW